MSEKLKIALGNDSFFPTVDGVNTVIKFYADYINRDLGDRKSVV